MVGSKRESVVGTRWIPREGLREGCRGWKVTTQDTHREREYNGRKDG